MCCSDINFSENYRHRKKDVSEAHFAVQDCRKNSDRSGGFRSKSFSDK